jgi:hypothetical protein
MTTLKRFWYHVYYVPIRTPIRNLWFRWKHRHETPEQREERIADTKVLFREIYEKHREHLTELPASREVQENIEFWDDVMDGALGKFDRR